MAQIQFAPDATVSLSLPVAAVQVILTALDELPRKQSQATFELIVSQATAQAAPPAPAPEIDPALLDGVN